MQACTQLKSRGTPVRYIRLDLAGENYKLAKRTGNSEWEAIQPLDFEFTSRDTPHHNSMTELAFPYLAGKARAMMGAARVPEDIKSKVALEAIACATQLDGLVVVDVKGKWPLIMCTCSVQTPRGPVSSRYGEKLA